MNYQRLKDIRKERNLEARIPNTMEGYKEPTWESAENLEHAQDIIKDYWHRKQLPLPLKVSAIDFQDTNIILAIKPEFAEAICTQKKNHKYPKYLI